MSNLTDEPPDLQSFHPLIGSIMVQSLFRLASLAAITTSLATSISSAQSATIDNELNRLNGHWRVIEMVENGRSVHEGQMRQLLPGGGTLEIIDFTVLFESPLDGSKSTKSFRLNPASYPKQIAIVDRDRTDGTGIYEFDNGKLVICITPTINDYPTEFSAPQNSQRTLLVMQRFEVGKNDIPGRSAPVAQTQPTYSSSPTPAVANVAPPSVPVATAKIALPNPPIVMSRPTVVVGNPTGRSLSDSEVHNLALGTWRINDAEGAIDIVLNPNGVFRTFRYSQVTQNFHTVFAPTPTSAGTWSVLNGRLMAQITQSSRLDKVNQSFVPAVRSISAKDMILEDHLGRVTRAIKMY